MEPSVMSVIHFDTLAAHLVVEILSDSRPKACSVTFLVDRSIFPTHGSRTLLIFSGRLTFCRPQQSKRKII